MEGMDEEVVVLAISSLLPLFLVFSFIIVLTAAIALFLHLVSGENSRRKVCGLGGHKVSPPPAGLKSWLAKYQTWSPAQKRYALDSLIDVCDLNEVRNNSVTTLLASTLCLFTLTLMH